MHNPWLKIGPIDFFSQQTIADWVVEGLATDREKALAIFYFYITHRFHKGNGDNTAQGDVSQAMNVFGFNTCGNSTLCLSDLLDKVGMRDCIFSHNALAMSSRRSFSTANTTRWTETWRRSCSCGTITRWPMSWIW